VYAARTESLAKLEALVHLKPATGPRLVLVEATIPNALVATLTGTLPAGWDDVPDSGAGRSVGDAWLQSGSSLALEVPSIHSNSDTNVLINPAHPDFGQLVIGNPVPFAFDRRLIEHSRR
jgi:RES domain-containing protein